ncbi:hypothetical protein NDU88_008697 [Pleurodeles waltl]|uniref:ribonuclease H n=1 Tax=Pleurodeles waltl TaxID=8319 RepID=A0AAV7PSY9_PLEWA|nr:hypothetical protein NDU88_008697 [Pleurodeles waltl]
MYDEEDTRQWVVQEFPGVFSGCVGQLKGFAHLIRLKEGAKPKIQKVRNIPFIVRDEVKKELDRLQSLQIIEPVEASEWVSPLVVARKANGKVRLCVDLRGLNENIIMDQFPLPRIDEMLSATRDAKWFSTLDLSSGYHQVKLDYHSRHLTTFCTPWGCFRFKSMPFGLASGAAVFQRLMAQLFGHLPNVTFFQDYILVMGSSKKRYDKEVRHVLHILQKTGLTAESSKCRFAQRNVTYLGHEIDQDGIRPKKKLVEAIRNAPSPTSKDDLRSFLGLAEFYLKFVENF